MAALETFNPQYTQGITVAPGAVAASSTIGLNCKTLCLTNLGAITVYVRTYKASDGAKSATTADYPVLPLTQVTITKPDNHDTLTYIGAAGASLHVIPGEGW